MEKYNNIIDRMVEMKWMVKDYKKIDESNFRIMGKLSDFGYYYLFKFSLAEDLIRLNIIYYFGKMLSIDENDLLGILVENTGTFSVTNSYMGMEMSDDDYTIYTTLNSSLYFLTKHNDQDIALMISCALDDIEGVSHVNFPKGRFINFVEEKMKK